MASLHRRFLWLAWLMAGLTGWAQPFSAVVSLGDSLSDTTNNPATGDNWEGRYSNGPLWDEYLAADFGATLYDYAFSGSETTALAGQATNASKIAWDTTNTLFTVWSGANDFIDHAMVNGLNIADWTSTVSEGVNNTARAVFTLASSGARFVVVLNLPDLGRLPAVTQDATLGPYSSVIRNLAQEYNEELEGALAGIAQGHPKLRLVFVDDFSLMDEIVSSPASYGFTVVTNDALDVLGDPGFGVPAANYLFWDVIHPTTKAAALVAQLVETNLAQIPPTLLAGPANQTVAVGSQVEFVAEAQNASAYQWLFNGRKIKGATNATYAMASVTAARAGSYSVIVSNPYGGTVSPAARLTVDTSPKFVVNPRSENGVAGRAVILSALAAGTGPISYQWQFGGSNITGAMKRVLILTNLDTNETGSYAAVAVNPVGVVTSRVAMLNVVVPPSITSQPQGANATQSDEVVFSVTATGTLPLRYQWQFDGLSLARQTNSSLTLPSVRLGQAGRYRVLVRNLGGAAASSNAVLKVARYTAPTSGFPIEGPPEGQAPPSGPPQPPLPVGVGD